MIYVSGGSVANLLALWRLHGLDEVVRARRGRPGVVLSGQSAGALCWHVGGNTDSFGPELRRGHDGLGLLPYSCGVHYNSDQQRRPLLQQLGRQRRAARRATRPTRASALHYAAPSSVQAVTDRSRRLRLQVEHDGAGGDRGVPDRASAAGILNDPTWR